MRLLNLILRRPSELNTDANAKEEVVLYDGDDIHNLVFMSHFLKTIKSGPNVDCLHNNFLKANCLCEDYTCSGIIDIESCENVLSQHLIIKL